MKGLHSFVFILFLLGLSLAAMNAFAGEATFDEQHTPTVDEVVNALKPDANQDIKLRGINYKPQMPEPKVISVKLEFEKGSSELTEGTKKNLAMVGKALNSDDLKGLKFTLEGHADASGSDEYNLNLSKKRAESVKQYLVQAHNVDPKNFKVIGKGEQDLLDPNDPLSMKNRRVRIITNQ